MTAGLLSHFKQGSTLQFRHGKADFWHWAKTEQEQFGFHQPRFALRIVRREDMRPAHYHASTKPYRCWLFAQK